jgi:hypothetical protein
MTRHQNKQNTNMKTDIKKTGTKTATAALAEINNRIAELQQQRVALAEPLKARFGELRNEQAAVETEIRSLDSNWRPEPMKPKAETKIAEIITSHGSPMPVEEIIQAVGGAFTPWKVKNVLKKRLSGPKAMFTLADGKYTVRAAA